MTRRLLALLPALLLAACATGPTSPRVERTPAEVRAQVESLLPASLADREGWAADLQGVFEDLDVPPSTENLCAAMAVIEQESGYVPDPPVANLSRIAREEIDRRAAAKHVPRFVVHAALAIESPDGRRYADRIARVRTERELSQVFEDFIGMVPMGRRLFGDANPVRTGGPMQVSIDFAERHARARGGPRGADGSVRHAVFTRRGGLHYGIAHLLDYPSSYTRHLHRFADFNAGWYASRNAAFQSAVALASGRKLALDGDLLVEDRVGETEAAVRALPLGFGEAEIRRALARADRHDFEDTELYAAVFELAERRAGRELPRAVVPQIRLQSPKITRPLTTAWFADRVQQRYQRCVNRAFGVAG